MAFADLNPFVYVVLAGVIPTAIWRWAGVLAVGGIDEDAEILVLVRCIATALVAAVIAQLVLFPTGALSQIPMPVRVGAAVAGLATHILAGHRLWLSVLVGEALLLGGYWLA
ncbi:MAG: AzlD domain-containing protein [Pseudomonadota bacterium]